jgi:putative transposase
LLIDTSHTDLSITRQCELLGVSRSSLYYQPKEETPFNLQLMRLIDEQYIRTPFYGVPRMTAWLRREGHQVNPKRIRRLMRLMGLEVVYPKPRLSQSHPQHRKFPYLLRDLSVTGPDQVWMTDITYIRLNKGFAYLVAILDWFSRYVVAWEMDITLETGFCLKALERALAQGRCEIFNSDQGCQFTSAEFTKRLEQEGIRISMDGRGRVYDNIFVERLWRTLKYEEVYLKAYDNVFEALREIGRYFAFYNGVRLHQSLGYQTPAEVYFGSRKAVGGASA